MKSPKYARPRMGIADFGPPAKLARPPSWDVPARGRADPYNRSGGGVPGRVKRGPQTGGGKMIDLSPSEYSWMPERMEIPRTPAQKRRFLWAAKAAMNTGKLLRRFSPWLRAVDTALDIYDFATWLLRPGQMPSVIFTGSPTCSTYRPDRDIPTPTCNYAYHLGTGNVGAGNCSSFHSGAQALVPIQAHHNAWLYGPLRGGIYACERFDVAYVVRYANAATRNANPPIITPYRAPTAWWSPTLVVPTPLAKESGYGVPRVPKPHRSLRPYESPSMSFGPPPRGRPTWFPDYHGHLPPVARKEEKKGRTPIPSFFHKAGKVYGAWTEASDFLDAMYAGLPDRVKRRWHDDFDKAQALWDHWEQWDWQKAAWAFAENQAKDYAIGRANKAAQRALTRSPYWKRPVGPGAGGFQQRNVTRFR